MDKKNSDKYKYTVQISAAFNILLCIILLIVACVIDSYTSSVEVPQVPPNTFIDTSYW